MIKNILNLKNGILFLFTLSYMFLFYFYKQGRRSVIVPPKISNLWSTLWKSTSRIWKQPRRTAAVSHQVNIRLRKTFLKFLRGTKDMSWSLPVKKLMNEIHHSLRVRMLKGWIPLHAGVFNVDWISNVSNSGFHYE